MRSSLLDKTIFKNRRDKLSGLVGDGVFILTSQPDYIRNNDVHYPYRQDTNFFYLTGFEEPGSVFVFRPGQNPETIMFVRKKDAVMETWDGFRFGPDGTQSEFGIDKAFTTDQIESKLPDLLKDTDKIYYTLFKDHKSDQLIEKVLADVKMRRGRSGKGILSIEDSYPVIGEMRLFKSEDEVSLLRRAGQATAESHVEVMKATQPGVNERELHGRFIFEIMKRGCAREGYGGIFAGGDNATTLHYVFNDQPLKDGDLLLVDAGGEYNYYTADITRTFPVSGKFSETQKRIYNKILDLQEEIIAEIKPGKTMREFQDLAVSRLVDLMISEGLLTGSKDKLTQDNAFKKYYPHGVGHWLGSDVHDAGRMEIKGEPRKIEPGMCFTIEPGIYIPQKDQDAPQELRGIGIRIEDNILVTENGCEVLTAFVPKKVEDIENLMANR